MDMRNESESHRLKHETQLKITKISAFLDEFSIYFINGYARKNLKAHQSFSIIDAFEDNFSRQRLKFAIQRRFQIADKS